LKAKEKQKVVIEDKVPEIIEEKIPIKQLEIIRPQLEK
jgi:hypothetical protein